MFPNQIAFIDLKGADFQQRVIVRRHLRFSFFGLLEKGKFEKGREGFGFALSAHREF